MQFSVLQSDIFIILSGISFMPQLLFAILKKIMQKELKRFLAIYSISDLHLPFGADKPMNIFKGWDNYTDRIKANWNRMISNDDTVIIPGDISWALKLDESAPDFEFINSLKGNKIIAKGNHDFWWSTVTKINEFLEKNSFNTIKILFNNAFLIDGISVCGTRGWLYDGTGDKDIKVIKRECGRLKMSLDEGKRLGGKLVVFLHYPFAYGDFVCEELYSLLVSYGVEDVFYGHIHGSGFNKSLSSYGGIRTHIVSCDCIDFSPICVSSLVKNK